MQNGFETRVFFIYFQYDFFHTCSSIKEMDLSKATFQVDIVIDLITASKSVQKWDFTDSEYEDKGK